MARSVSGAHAQDVALNVGKIIRHVLRVLDTLDTIYGAHAN